MILELRPEPKKEENVEEKSGWFKKIKKLFS